MNSEDTEHAAPQTADEWAAHLATAPIGAETAAQLPLAQREELTPAGHINLIRALERHTEWLEAQQLQALAALPRTTVTGIPGRSDDTGELDITVEEVACALRISNAKAAQRLEQARRLVAEFPSTVKLLEDGRIHLMQARAVHKTTANCTPEVARAAEQHVLPLMPEQTTGATRDALRRAVIHADPAGAEQRKQKALEKRTVWHTEAEDGMSTWSALVDTIDAARMDAAVDEHAQAMKTSGDKRSLNQRRADAAVGLITGDLAHKRHTDNSPRPGGTPRNTSRSAPVVLVTVGYDTLIGAADEPGELKGYGPVTAGQARALATEPGSIWRRLLIEPDTGRLVKTDPNTYRPTAETVRHVLARDGTCTFPSCSMPAHRTDLDHVTPFGQPGGTTTPENLIPLCRRHHLAKHRGNWTPVPDPETGAVHWTSPTGQQYTKPAHSYR